MLMTPTTRRAEVKTPSRLPPPKEISTAACVHGAVAGRPPRPVRAAPDHFCGVGCPTPLNSVVSPIARRAG